MRISPSLRAAPAAGRLVTAVAVAGLVGVAGLTAGCGTDTNPAADPSVHSDQPLNKFDPFPEPKTWNLSVGPAYTAIFGPLSGKTSGSGTKKKTFTITGQPDLVFWLGCLGTGTARLSSPDMTLDWTVPCGVNRTPGGINVNPTHAPAGKKVTVVLTVTAGSSWSLRIDALATAVS
jgi:hypothetical protein